jgi:neopullulanase
MKHILIFGIAFGCGEPTKNTPIEDSGIATDELCETAFHYQTDSSPDGVRLAGEFNDWAIDEHPMDEWADGQWSTSIRLPPGAHAYQFIEFTAWEYDGAVLWTCDENASLAVCDSSTTQDLEWGQNCEAGQSSCNSLIQVEDCSRPRIEVTEMAVDDDQLTAWGTVHTPSGEPATVRAEIDGVGVELSMDGPMFHVEHSGLEVGRHTLSLSAEDEIGATAIPIEIPFWNDEWTPEQAIIYHALIDRFANGNPDNDAPAETTHAITDWAGGDLDGLIEALPYLDSLGINTIWISNPQTAPEGAWPGDCSATYSGYHGFWPTSWEAVDPHLGDMATLDRFIEAAHDRGMRVWMDWVANHVHSEHPAAENIGQFHTEAICKDIDWEGVSNWDRIPESCWFTEYLPDWDHSDTQVINSVVEMAVDWASARKLDGLRVDAAKHMSHAVLFNLRHRTQKTLSPPGSNGIFPLIGETFDNAPLINAYIGPDQLHGQFDFPLYWTLRSAFIHDTTSVGEAVQQAAAMESNYPGGMMSTFLGNLDVGRFLTEAHEYSSDVCPDGDIRQAGTPEDGEAFDRLRLAWTLLFTQPGMPMIYYGDELGLPGYGDPDNRQPLAWHNIDLTEHDATSLMETLSTGQARVLDTVMRLTDARFNHPALRGGSQVEWWDGGPGLYATAHLRDGDQAIVVLNRTDTEQWLDNGLGFAGLTGENWTDVLSGEQFVAGEDRLIVSVPPHTPRVLVLTE